MNDALYQDEPHAGGSVSPPTEVHPLAALFPMLADDDLKSLAEDIKENGLQQPIVIDESGVLIDGRNRLEACLRAGVEPRYLMIDSADAGAFIWSANVKRRHMAKGQTAMVAAMGFINVDKTSSRKGGRPDQGIGKAAKQAGVSYGTMTKAFLVRDHAPDLVERVIAGDLFLDPAFVTAQERKKARDWLDDGLGMLRKQDPELARRVSEGELSLDQARQMLLDRDKAEATARDAVLLNIASMTRSAIGFAQSETVRKVPQWLSTEAGMKDHLRYFEGGPTEILEKITAARAGLDVLTEIYSSAVQAKD